MGALFGRVCRLSIGSLGLEGFDVTFRVKRSLWSFVNSAEISVYNLSLEHRNQIYLNARRRRFDVVRLEAGYKDATWLLFRGDVRVAKTDREGPNWITRITAADGMRGVQTGRVYRSFAPGATVDTVLRALADALGVGVGNAADAVRQASLNRVGDRFPSGTVLAGSAARELTRLTASAGLEWSIQDGVLQVLPVRGSLRTTALRLTPSTGLLTPPITGINRLTTFQAALLPDLVPGRRVVTAETEGSRGDFTIVSAEYTGATAGEDWTASLVCRATQPNRPR